LSEIAFINKLENKLIGFDPDLRHLTAEEQRKRIMSKVADIPESVVSPGDLLERLKKSKEVGKPLTVKFGIDPTGPDIHIGHAVPLINLRLFQRMGHKILLIIGDFTGMIGDPSGRMDDRPALTEQEMEANMATYEDQAARIIDLRDPSIERHYNSKWMNKITLREWVNVIKKVPASALLQREDFRERLAGGHGLSLAEMEYALFMGYDSVVLEPDLEIGGMDQYLNMHVCRDMMTNAGQKPEIIVTYNLLAGTTGEKDEQGRYIKMSKSRGNYIPVTAEPADMYGKVMSIPDEIMWIWYRELTEITSDDLKNLRTSVEQGKIHPKEAKQLLARVIVGTFNSFDSKIIQSAEEEFNEKFGKKAVLVPDSTIEFLISPVPVDTNTPVTDTTPGSTIDPQATWVTSLSNISGRSKSDIRRLVKQNGIVILEEGKQEDYEPMKFEELTEPSSLLDNKVVRVGKRHYFKFKKKE
jgi:tyrosyl-tRNA synthetase